MKVLSIVGARPEFVQAMPVSRAIARRGSEVLVHTGQHFDAQMSQAFFDDLSLPRPAYHLAVGPASRARQLAAIVERLEPIIMAERPDVMLVRGDTTSTLAGALAANQTGIPLAHIEAGERSDDWSMPEESSRVVADHLADVRFCASEKAVARLATEGLTREVHWVGDVMCDAVLAMRETALAKATTRKSLGLSRHGYALVTVHRAGNTDDTERLRSIVHALNQTPGDIVFPVHPRTRAALDRIHARWRSGVHLLPPVGYLEMLALVADAAIVATDSGGVQREAYMLGVPCLTFRDETEWSETVDAGWNTLVDVDPARILAGWTSPSRPDTHPPLFGDGQAGERIATLLLSGVAARGFSARRRTTPVGATR